MVSLNDKTALYGLIGRKLGHSYSADFFNHKFEEEHINAVYSLYPLPLISDFPRLLEDKSQIRGLNVTVPYKEEVVPYLDILSDDVKEIGAVNVIKIDRNLNHDKLILRGYNTDVIGFRESLIPLLKPDVRSALVLGTGGASKAVCYVLKKLGIEYKLVSRNKGKGDLTYNELSRDIINNNLLIVNTTPVGMYPATELYPDFPYSYLTSRHICYDLIYNPEETKFLSIAKQHGATVKNGLEMLKLQAVESWKIWIRKD